MEMLGFSQCFLGVALFLGFLIGLDAAVLSLVWRAVEVDFLTWLIVLTVATGVELWVVSGVSRQVRRIRTQYRVTVRRQ